ncbi:MAG: acetyl-CoA C-acyltransferase, partial [Bhargavaea sp.]
MARTAILGGARTPFGKFGGLLASQTASDLGGVAIRAALERTGTSPDDVDEVIMGTVLQGG